MGNRSKGQWIVLVIVLAAVIASVVMVRTGDEHTRQLGRYLGWGAIVVLVIARFALRRPAPPAPPMPRD